MTTTCTMILGDCLEVMPTLPKASVQMVFTDPPFAMVDRTCTNNDWDCIFDLELFWSSLPSCVVKSARIIFYTQQPFASAVVASNQSCFKYEIITLTPPRNWLHARHMPLRSHGNVLIFGRGAGTYNPQMTPKTRLRYDPTSRGRNYKGDPTQIFERNQRDGMFPRTVINPHQDKNRFTGKQRVVHPTQKPVALLDWLIRTYSNEGDLVLDPTSGSGTTAVSAAQNGRSVTCIEKDENYHSLSVERVRKHIRDNLLDVKTEVRR